MTGRDAIAVVGTGVLVPGASSPDELWKLLLDGEPVFGEPGERFAVEDFWSADRSAEDRTYSRVSGYLTCPEAEREAVGGECAQWLRHCLVEATHGVHLGPTSRVSCFSGQWVDGHQGLEESVLATLVLGWAAARGGCGTAVREVVRRHLPRSAPKPRELLPDAVLDAALRGLFPTVVERLVVDTACSSSLYAIDLGARALAAGECDVALCGGVYQVTPRYSVMFSKVQGLSPSGVVRSFDRRADGTLFSDGAAMIALKRLDDALGDGDEVLAVLHGFGAACDGAGKAVQAPNPAGQRLAMSRASVSDADWVLAHGTATPVGDLVELTVLQERRGDAAPLPVTSNKSLIGHTGWAAGAVSVVHAVEALRRGLIPAQHRFTELPPALTGVHVPTRHLPWPVGGRPRTVGISGFGFGGTNAHLRLGDPDAAPATGATQNGDATVLVAWSRLEGSVRPGPEDVREIRLVPRTLREIDGTQARAVLVARRFAARHGVLWQGIEERTGVVSGFWEPPRRSADTTVRVYRDVIERIVDGLRLVGASEAAEAVERGASDVRERSAPIGPDTLAGVMPNVAPARIANRENLRGLSMAVCDGPDSFLASVRTAHRYLAAGDLDLVLVLAGNGNTEAWAATTTGLDPGELRADTVLFALTRESYALERDWPALARLTPLTDGTSAPLSADAADELVRGIGEFGAPFVLPGRRPGAGRLHVEPLPAPLTSRHVPTLVPEAAVPCRTPQTALPPGALVLTDSPEVAAALAAWAPTVVCTAPGRPDPRITYVEEVTDDTLRETATHVRVICSPSGAPDAEPEPATVRLQELAFLAARALWLGDGRGSFLTVCLDAFTARAPRPHTALFRGMAKSLFLDLPDCRIATVLTDERDPLRGLEQVALESACPAELQGTQLRDGLRRVTRVVPAPLPRRRRLLVDDDSVVVATGGARGITGACLEGLARHVRVHVWLLGRSLPEAAQEPLVRVDFLRAWLAGHPGERPAAADAAFTRRLRAHESRQTVERLRAALGPERVHYLSCDVTDAGQVRDAAAHILARHPRIDLFLHGAGINRSSSPGHKTLADFRFVSSPKIAGYHRLKEAFGPSVVHWCSFGSISGTLGQPGEADYAAANDYLSACAEFASAEGLSEFTVAWTLWREVGMGASRLRQALGARRAQLSGISPEEGRAHFLAELGESRPADATVLTLGERERHTLHGRLPRLVAEPR